MSSGFKHIAAPGEARWEEISDGTTVMYAWRYIGDAQWEERFWSFSVWSLMKGDTVSAYEVRTKDGRCVPDERPRRLHMRFPSLDEAGAFVYKEVSARSNEGYSIVRFMTPTGENPPLNPERFAGAE